MHSCNRVHAFSFSKGTVEKKLHTLYGTHISHSRERTKNMIIILKKQAEEAQINALKKEMTDQGLGIHESEGVNTRIIGLVGDTSVVDMRHIMANSIVENVQRIQEPYKKANRKFHPNDTVVDVSGVKIGGGNFQVIAGPCSIETKEQITEVANDVKNSGAGLLRGGAFKPRTSPYSFQGLHGDGDRKSVV